MTAPDLVVGPKPVDVDTPAPDVPDQRLWSVTTIIGALDKPALVPWAAKETAIAALRSRDTVTSIEQTDGTDEAVRWLSAARYRRPQGQRSASELGTAFHEAAEEYALSGTRPELADDPEIRPFFDQYDGWLQRVSPSFEAVESTVYHPDYGYAGTTDGFLTIDGVRFIFDYKSSRKAVDGRGKPTTPYPEVALQLAAYRYAKIAALWRPRRFEQYRRRYYLLSSQELDQAIPVPEVDGGICIHVTPEHCEAFPVWCDETVFERFLYVLEAARWVFQDAKNAIGEPITIGASR